MKTETKYVLHNPETGECIVNFHGTYLTDKGIDTFFNPSPYADKMLIDKLMKEFKGFKLYECRVEIVKEVE